MSSHILYTVPAKRQNDLHTQGLIVAAQNAVQALRTAKQKTQDMDEPPVFHRVGTHEMSAKELEQSTAFTSNYEAYYTYVGLD